MVADNSTILTNRALFDQNTKFDTNLDVFKKNVDSWKYLNLY